MNIWPQIRTVFIKHLQIGQSGLIDWLIDWILWIFFWTVVFGHFCKNKNTKMIFIVNWCCIKLNWIKFMSLHCSLKKKKHLFTKYLAWYPSKELFHDCKRNLLMQQLEGTIKKLKRGSVCNQERNLLNSFVCLSPHPNHILFQGS